MKEVWKIVDRFNKYECSNLGKIRHIKNRNILNPTVCSQGYYLVGLCNNDTPVKQKYIRVHRIIANVFLSKSGKVQVNHKDANKLNNIVSNLEWCTPKENTHHAMKLGLHPNGEKNGHSKLSQFDVRNILVLGKFCKNGNLAILYGVSPSTICDIMKRRTWKHIEI